MFCKHLYVHYNIANKSEGPVTHEVLFEPAHKLLLRSSAALAMSANLL